MDDAETLQVCYLPEFAIFIEVQWTQAWSAERLNAAAVLRMHARFLFPSADGERHQRQPPPRLPAPLLVDSLFGQVCPELLPGSPIPR